MRYLIRTGVRQFLDIGTGYPTTPNVHEAAQAITPHTRVLYVDNGYHAMGMAVEGPGTVAGSE